MWNYFKISLYFKLSFSIYFLFVLMVFCIIFDYLCFCVWVSIDFWGIFDLSLIVYFVK